MDWKDGRTSPDLSQGICLV